MRIADIKKQNIELKKQNAELKKELDLANDQLKAFESLISRKESKIGELIKQNSELSVIILRQSEELRSANEKLTKRKGLFSWLW
ncbi:MAG: hypothetical protein MR481_05990 [Campylobacter sp.]|uniref:hypothetical protein n=1 Tax=Campylobacter sp. TaxID=205 RepID=UPI002AA617D9|nr:hypothetical protein [Campylobacter sp.]MCI7247456.1 hypothetical protein [Campylobacter sp.]